MREKGLRFIGSGVSGGEEGARFGPSLMPGGDFAAWKELKPIWEAVAAKVDAKTGKPIPGRHARQARHRRRALHDLHRRKRRGPLREDGPQRHRVRRHADDLRGLRADEGLLGLKPAEMGAIFSEWNTGMLDSFLIEITADILKQKDP